MRINYFVSYKLDTVRQSKFGNVSFSLNHEITNDSQIKQLEKEILVQEKVENINARATILYFKKYDSSKTK